MESGHENGSDLVCLLGVNIDKGFIEEKNFMLNALWLFMIEIKFLASLRKEKYLRGNS
jgi:hypothetical protein